jgi:hypothetical protein
MPALATIGPCTIRAGESLSDAVDCTGSTRIVRVIMPDQFDGAAAMVRDRARAREVQLPVV